MRPRGKLVALLAVFAAIGLVTASGAFTTVTATRTATADVAGDSAALLAMEPADSQNGNGGASDTNSDGYAQLSSGTLAINLAGFNSNSGSPTAQGVNLNATTDIQQVFVITNQGSQQVNVSISDSDGSGDDQYITFYNATHAPHDADRTTEEGLEGGNVTLDSGDSVVVSLYIQTPGQTALTDDGGTSARELLSGDFTVYANATQ